MKHDYDAIVIGAGIFGLTIDAALRRQGCKTLLLDRGEKHAGSNASGNLMKPGWYAGLGKKVHEPAVKLLEELYGIEEHTFKAGKAAIRKSVKVNYIAMDRMFLDDNGSLVNITPGDVTTLSPGMVVYKDFQTKASNQATAPIIVVAAGFWTNQLLGAKHGYVQGKQGISFLWEGARYRGKVDNLITPWAPYKQVVQFNRRPDDGSIWAGDGTAILAHNWTDEREAQSRERVVNHVGLGRPTKAIVGVRPMVKGKKPCLFEQVQPGIWVATGGAKNGLVAAGWCAHRLVEEAL